MYRLWNYSVILVALTILSSYLLSGQSSLQGRSFTFVRISFPSRIKAPGNQPWEHDYPRAEENLLGFLASEVGLATSPADHRVLSLSDPEFFHYPLLYVSEPGYWSPTQGERDQLRRYLQAGGLLILDDFRGEEEWRRVEEIFRAILSDRSFEELASSDGPFQALYELDSTELPAPYDVPGQPACLGIKNEDGGLMVVAFWNSDLGDLWEWSNLGLADERSRRLIQRGLQIGANTVVTALRR